MLGAIFLNATNEIAYFINKTKAKVPRCIKYERFHDLFQSNGTFSTCSSSGETAISVARYYNDKFALYYHGDKKNGTIYYETTREKQNTILSASVFAVYNRDVFCVASTYSYEVAIHHGLRHKYIVSEQIKTNHLYNTIIVNPCQMGFIQLEDSLHNLVFLSIYGEIWKKHSLETFSNFDITKPFPVAIANHLLKKNIFVIYNNGLIKILKYYCDKSKWKNN